MNTSDAVKGIFLPWKGRIGSNNNTTKNLYLERLCGWMDPKLEIQRRFSDF